MSADEWDAEDFEPAAPVIKATDKWEGEDEGEDIKDSWEDESEKKEEVPDEMKAVQRKKKKPLAERIAEKEAARAEAEKREKEESKEMTKEEKSAEAERLKKMQEAADLKIAKEAFGVEATGIDGMFPVTEEEFTKFKDALKTKISHFSTSKHYGAFIEKLTIELLTDVNVEDLKRISVSASSLFHEKQKLLKEAEKKTKKKGKAKTVVRTERDDDFGDLAAAGRGDYDDSYYDEDFI